MKAAPQRNLGITFFAVLYIQNVRDFFQICPPISEDVVKTVYSSVILLQKKLSAGKVT